MHVNGSLDWLISGHQNVNPLKEVISILSGEHKRFTFANPVIYRTYTEGRSTTETAIEFSFLSF